MEAVQRAGAPWGQPPPPLSEEERRILDDLPLDNGVTDPWLLGLLIGNRSPDIESGTDTDPSQFAVLHSDPATQQEHCLRRANDDGTEGDRAALAACRDAIRAHLILGLGESDVLDPQVMDPIGVALVFRGPTTIWVSRFSYQLGRALHTLQDGFSHAQRPFGGLEVGTVNNFIDLLHHYYDPARDGSEHLGARDDCYDGDTLRPHAQAAIAASAELLAAIADATGGRAGRLARVDTVLERHLSYTPGCTFENQWCDTIPKGCSATGPGRPAATSGIWLAVLAIVGLSLWRRRLRRLVLLIPLLSVAVSSPARADDNDITPPSVQKESTQLVSGRVSRVGIYTGLAGSLGRGAGAIDVGVRVHLGQRFTLQADVEFNPWFSLTKPYVNAGTLNIYAGLSVAWVNLHGLLLRTGVQLGSSTLLANTVAADAGTTGVFTGMSILGFTLPVRHKLLLDLDPAWLVLSIPQTRGIPFLYHQYRIAVGLRWLL